MTAIAEPVTINIDDPLSGYISHETLPNDHTYHERVGTLRDRSDYGNFQ
jgi:hypothetical protein